MKRFLLLFVLVFESITCFSQTYPAFRINLLSHIDPQSTVGIGSDGRKYSGCWGWFQSAKNKEYGIVGSSAGVYFVDVTSPTTPTVCDYVPGKSGCTWREIKSYQNYCYVVSDDAAPNSFLIVDMQYLPDSVHVVYDGNSTYFERGHTIYIDKDKMYIGSETKMGGAYNPMTVYSLATPSNPAFLRSLTTDVPSIGMVHDMFVINDTIFASCGNGGLYIMRLQPNNTFTVLGSFINYSSGSAYNHASYITQNRKNLVFTDEVPASLPIKIIDIQNFSNISIASTVNPYPQTTPHNPYVLGNRWAIVSCYQDGLNIFDINNPSNPVFAGFFDTHPQGGANMGSYPGSAYRGNWGAYPFFPSGNILALDMQNGVFLLDASQVFSQPIGVKENHSENLFAKIYPNPANSQLNIISNMQGQAEITIKNLLGQTVLTRSFENFGNRSMDVSALQNGTYFISINSTNGSLIQKIIINN